MVVNEPQYVDDAVIGDAKNHRMPRIVNPFRRVGDAIPAVPNVIDADTPSHRRHPFDPFPLRVVGQILHRLHEKGGVAHAPHRMEPLLAPIQ